MSAIRFFTYTPTIGAWILPMIIHENRRACGKTLLGMFRITNCLRKLLNVRSPQWRQSNEITPLVTFSTVTGVHVFWESAPSPVQTDDLRDGDFTPIIHLKPDILLTSAFMQAPKQLPARSGGFSRNSTVSHNPTTQSKRVLPNRQQSAG